MTSALLQGPRGVKLLPWEQNRDRVLDAKPTQFQKRAAAAGVLPVTVGLVLPDGTWGSKVVNVPTTSGPPPLPVGYSQTVFYDDFDGSSVDSSKWYVRNDYLAGNELAVRRAQNVTVANGRLVIQPKRESYKGRNYTSGEIYSDGKASWTAPFRQDVWAWLPNRTNASSVLWPAIWNRAVNGLGEIDVMEAWGTPVSAHATGGDDPTGRYSCHIFPNTNTTAGGKGGWAIPLNTNLTTLHKYSLVVDKDGSTTFLYDDVARLNYKTADYPFLGTSFAGGYTLRLTLQIGQPSWYGAPIDSAMDLTQTYSVERVAVYKP